MEAIQFINLSPEELENRISEKVRAIVLEATQAKEDPEVFLTSEKACEFFEVSLPTLSKWAKQKNIPQYCLGRLIRYKKSELIAALVKI